MTELASKTALGGNVGDTFEDLVIARRDADGLYFWVRNPTGQRETAAEQPVDASGFSGNLAATDTNLQAVADKVDALTVSGAVDAALDTASANPLRNQAIAGLVGLPTGATDFGTFTGAATDDNENLKTLIQNRKTVAEAFGSLVSALGGVKEGINLSGNGLGFDVTSGTMYTWDAANARVIATPMAAATNMPFNLVLQDGTVSQVGATTINPLQWDNGGTLTVMVQSNDAQVFRIYGRPGQPYIVMPGQEEYTTLSNARSRWQAEQITLPAALSGYMLLGVCIIQGDAAATQGFSAFLVQSSKIGEAGVAKPGTLNELANQVVPNAAARDGTSVSTGEIIGVEAPEEMWFIINEGDTTFPGATKVDLLAAAGSALTVAQAQSRNGDADYNTEGSASAFIFDSYFFSRQQTLAMVADQLDAFNPRHITADVTLDLSTVPSSAGINYLTKVDPGVTVTFNSPTSTTQAIQNDGTEPEMWLFESTGTAGQVRRIGNDAAGATLSYLTAAEILAGTDTTKVVNAVELKAELDRREISGDWDRLISGNFNGAAWTDALLPVAEKNAWIRFGTAGTNRTVLGVANTDIAVGDILRATTDGTTAATVGDWEFIPAPVSSNLPYVTKTAGSVVDFNKINRYPDGHTFNLATEAPTYSAATHSEQAFSVLIDGAVTLFAPNAANDNWEAISEALTQRVILRPSDTTDAAPAIPRSSYMVVLGNDEEFILPPFASHPSGFENRIEVINFNGVSFDIVGSLADPGQPFDKDTNGRDGVNAQSVAGTVQSAKPSFKTDQPNERVVIYKANDAAGFWTAVTDSNFHGNYTATDSTVTSETDPANRHGHYAVSGFTGERFILPPIATYPVGPDWGIQITNEDGGAIEVSGSLADPTTAFNNTTNIREGVGSVSATGSDVSAQPSVIHNDAGKVLNFYKAKAADTFWTTTARSTSTGSIEASTLIGSTTNGATLTLSGGRTWDSAFAEFDWIEFYSEGTIAGTRYPFVIKVTKEEYQEESVGRALSFFTDGASGLVWSLGPGSSSTATWAGSGWGSVSLKVRGFKNLAEVGFVPNSQVADATNEFLEAFVGIANPGSNVQRTFTPNRSGTYIVQYSNINTDNQISLDIGTTVSGSDIYAGTAARLSTSTPHRIAEVNLVAGTTYHLTGWAGGSTGFSSMIVNIRRKGALVASDQSVLVDDSTSRAIAGSTANAWASLNPTLTVPGAAGLNVGDQIVLTFGSGEKWYDTFEDDTSAFDDQIFTRNGHNRQANGNLLRIRVNKANGNVAIFSEDGALGITRVQIVKGNVL